MRNASLLILASILFVANAIDVCPRLNNCYDCAAHPSCSFSPQLSKCSQTSEVSSDSSWISDRHLCAPPNGSCVAGCTPRGHALPCQCDFYLQPQRLFWLPDGYANAAFCACSGDGSSVWVSPTAQCVRRYLMNAQSHPPPQLKWQMAALKFQLCSGPFNCTNEYYEWMIANFIPYVYDIHVQAYAHCCCPHSVAPFQNWIYTLFYNPAIANCSLVVEGIEADGYCGCQGW